MTTQKPKNKTKPKTLLSQNEILSHHIYTVPTNINTMHQPCCIFSRSMIKYAYEGKCQTTDTHSTSLCALYTA